MTIAELKKALEDIDDELIVHVRDGIYTKEATGFGEPYEMFSEKRIGLC